MSINYACRDETEAECFLKQSKQPKTKTNKKLKKGGGGGGGGRRKATYTKDTENKTNHENGEK